jgi:hypothetical protein
LERTLTQNGSIYFHWHFVYTYCFDVSSLKII